MGEVKIEFQENFAGIAFCVKICKKSAATEGFSSIAAVCGPKLYSIILLTKILRGHFEETVIDHFERIEGAVASFERTVQTFKGHFLLLYHKSVCLHFEEKIIIISKRQRQGIAIPLARR